MTTPTPTVAADGITPGYVDIVLRLGDNAPVSGVSVRLHSDCDACTITQPATTNAQGQTRAAIMSSNVLAATLYATAYTSLASTAVPGQVVIHFVPAASATRSSLTATPSSLPADGNARASLDLLAVTKDGAPVVGQVVTLMISGTDNTADVPAQTTDSQGAWHATLASSHAELKTVTAELGTARIATEVRFTAGAPDQATSSITAGDGNGTSGTGIADGVDTVPVTVVISDPLGNPVSGVTVTFTDSDPNGTVSRTSVVTDANGIATTGVTSTSVGSPTITATGGGVSVGTTVVFTPPTVSLTKSSFVASPASQTADGMSAITLTVTLNDSAGVPMANQNVTFTSTGAQASIVPPSGTTNAQGQLSASLTTTQAQSLDVNATINSNVTFQTRVGFVAGNANAATTQFTASPTSQTVAQPIALHVRVVDAYGNPLIGQGVTFTGNGSNSFSPAASGLTDNNGVFNANVTTTQAQSETVTMTTGAVTLGAAVTFIHAAMDAGHVTFTINPNTATTDSGSFIGLSLSVADVYGNAISGQAVSFVPSGISHTFNPAASGSTVGGVFNANLTSTNAQVEQISALVGGYTFTGGATFKAGQVNGFNSTLTATPASQVADGSSFIALSVQMVDSYHNPIPGMSVTFGANGSNNTIQPSSVAVTNAAGVANANLTTTLAQVEVASCANGVTYPLAAAVTFVAGAPAALTFTSAGFPSSLTTQPHTPCSFSGSYTATILDAHSNVVKTGSSNVTLALANAVQGTLGGTLTVASSNGNAVFSNLDMSLNGQQSLRTVQLVASAPGLTSAASPNVSITTCFSPYSTGVSVAPTGINTGDFNGDGYLDVIVSARSSNKVQVWTWASGQNTFNASAAITLAQQFHNLVVADYNADGYADFVVTDAANNSNTASGTLYSNNKSGGFTQTSLGLGYNPNSLSSMDINGDGKLDLLAGNDSGLISWILGAGNGTFSAWSGSTTKQFAATHIAYPAVGYLTSNAGVLDYAMTYYTGAWYVNSQQYSDSESIIASCDAGAFGRVNGKTFYLGIWNNSGANGFLFDPTSTRSSLDTSLPNNSNHLLAADLDGDGNSDLVATTDSGFEVAIANPNTYTFGAPISYALGHVGVWSDVGDYNQDGVIDVAVAIGDAQDFFVIFLP